MLCSLCCFCSGWSRVTYHPKKSFHNRQTFSNPLLFPEPARAGATERGLTVDFFPQDIPENPQSHLFLPGAPGRDGMGREMQRDGSERSFGTIFLG